MSVAVRMAPDGGSENCVKVRCNWFWTLESGEVKAKSQHSVAADNATRVPCHVQYLWHKFLQSNWVAGSSNCALWNTQSSLGLFEGKVL